MDEINTPEEQVQFKPGDIIKNRYTLVQQIGAGSYGTIFEANYQNENVYKHIAIKFEKITLNKPMLLNEISILKALADNKHFARYFQYGTYENYKFVAMELLGPCLIDLANRKMPYRFGLHSLLKFGVQAIEAIQALHKAGFVHRDIKPSNFVIGSTVETSNMIYLIDFGLSKKLNMKDGIVVMPSMNGNFRGTTRYASLNSHLGKEVGRNDDLMSLIYIFVEFYTGSLPWKNMNDMDEVMHLKELYQGGSLLAKMPPEFIQFEDHILSLDYTKEPDYQFLTSLLQQIASNNQIDINAPFDWEIEMKQIRDIQIQEKQNQYQRIQSHNSQISQKFRTFPNLSKDIKLKLSDNFRNENNIVSNLKHIELDQYNQNFNSQYLINVIKQKNIDLISLINNQQSQESNHHQQQQQNQENQQFQDNLCQKQQKHQQQQEYDSNININIYNNLNRNINQKDNNINNCNNQKNNTYIPLQINIQQNINQQLIIQQQQPIQFEKQNKQENQNQISSLITCPNNSNNIINIENNENQQKMEYQSHFISNQLQLPDLAISVKQQITPFQQQSIPFQYQTVPLDKNINEQQQHLQIIRQERLNNLNIFCALSSDALQILNLNDNQNMESNFNNNSNNCLSSSALKFSDDQNQFYQSNNNNLNDNNINKTKFDSNLQESIQQQQDQSQSLHQSESKQLKIKKAKRIDKQKALNVNIYTQDKQDQELNNQQILIKQQQQQKEEQKEEQQQPKTKNQQKNEQMNFTIWHQLKKQYEFNVLSKYRRKSFDSTYQSTIFQQQQQQQQPHQIQHKLDSMNLVFNNGNSVLQLIPAYPEHQTIGEMNEHIVVNSNTSNFSSYKLIKDENNHNLDNVSIMSELSNLPHNLSFEDFSHQPIKQVYQTTQTQRRNTLSQLESFESQFQLDSFDRIFSSIQQESDSFRDILLQIQSNFKSTDGNLLKNSQQYQNLNSKSSPSNSPYSPNNQFPQIHHSFSHNSFFQSFTQKLQQYNQLYQKSNTLKQYSLRETYNKDEFLLHPHLKYSPLIHQNSNKFSSENKFLVDKNKLKKQKVQNFASENDGYRFRIRSLSTSKESQNETQKLRDILDQCKANNNNNSSSSSSNNNNNNNNKPLKQVKRIVKGFKLNKQDKIEEIKTKEEQLKQLQDLDLIITIDDENINSEQELKTVQQSSGINYSADLQGSPIYSPIDPYLISQSTSLKDEQAKFDQLSVIHSQITQSSQQSCVFSMQTHSADSSQSNSHTQTPVTNYGQGNSGSQCCTTSQSTSQLFLTPTIGSVRNKSDENKNNSSPQKILNKIFNSLQTPISNRQDLINNTYQKIQVESTQLSDDNIIKQANIHQNSQTDKMNNDEIDNKEKDKQKEDQISIKETNSALSEVRKMCKSLSIDIPNIDQNSCLTFSVINSSKALLEPVDDQQFQFQFESIPNQANMKNSNNNLNEQNERKQHQRNIDILQTQIQIQNSPKKELQSVNNSLHMRTTQDHQPDLISTLIPNTSSLISSITKCPSNMSSQQQLLLGSQRLMNNTILSQRSLNKSETNSPATSSLMQILNFSSKENSPLSEKQFSTLIPIFTQAQTSPSQLNNKTSTQYQSDNCETSNGFNSDIDFSTLTSEKALQRYNSKSALQQTEAWSTDFDIQNNVICQHQINESKGNNNNLNEKSNQQKDCIIQQSENKEIHIQTTAMSNLINAKDIICMQDIQNNSIRSSSCCVL